jgi:hypothetical protein
MKEHVGRLTTSSLLLCGADDDGGMLAEGVDACPSWVGWGVCEALKRDDTFNRLSIMAKHFSSVS